MKVLVPIAVLGIALAAFFLMQQQEKAMEANEAIMDSYRLVEILDEPEGENLKGRIHELCDALLRTSAGREILQELDHAREDIAFHGRTRAAYWLVPKGGDGRVGLSAVIHGEEPDHPHGMSSGFQQFVVLDRIEVEGDRLRVEYHWSEDQKHAGQLEYLHLSAGNQVQTMVPVVEKGGKPITSGDLRIPGS